MDITIRPLEQGDFFPWFALYTGYADQAELPLSDERAMTVWSWLHSEDHAHQAVVAAHEDGTVVGLAHFSKMERLLQNDRGIFIEELYVGEAWRQQGVATALIGHLRAEVEEKGPGILRWMAAPENEAAQHLSESLATRNDRVVFDTAVR